MKKILSLLLAMSLLFALAACGGNKTPAETEKPEQTEAPAPTETPEATEKPEETKQPEETEQPEETPEQPEDTEAPAPTRTPVQPTPAPETPAPTETPSTSGSALDILNSAWNGLDEDAKFPAAGGDFSEENMVNDAPGKYALTNADEADRALALPSDWFAKVDDAASLTHLMNANTFTCGAFHTASAGDAAALSAAVRSNILARHWMCGFPDKLVVLTVGDYVISMFGHTDLIDAFAASLVANAGASIVYDEAIEV